MRHNLLLFCASTWPSRHMINNLFELATDGLRTVVYAFPLLRQTSCSYIQNSLFEKGFAVL